MKLIRLKNHYWWGFLWLAVGLLGWVAGGCVNQYIEGRSVGELLELVGDRQQADRVRLGVLEEVLGRSLSAEQQEKLGEQLGEVVKSQRHSPLIRERVAQIIVERYEDKAGGWLSEALIYTSEGKIQRQFVDDLIRLPPHFICGAGRVDSRLRGNDREVISNLIIALEENETLRGVQSNKVRGIIEKVSSAPLREVLREQMTQSGALRGRIAALAGLLRMEGREKVVEMLRVAVGEDAFMRELKFWGGQFGYLPSNRGRFLICHLQRQRLTNKQVEQLKEQVEKLSEREGYEFDVRDSYLLLNSPEGWLVRSRGQWEVEIDRWVKQREHTKRPASYAGAMDDYAEDFAGQRNLLSYTDLSRISVLLETLAEAERIDSLHRMVEEDRVDVKTEVGGLCFLEGARVRFERYKPGQRRGDNQYVDAPEMIEDAAWCLARWHVHVHSERGRELAGPGVDDLRYAAYFDSPLVVVTKIKERECNVDYVSAEGVVIDLGNY